MASRYEELDYQQTSLGELILRRRTSPVLPEGFVYEVKLDNQLLMSSTVNAGERALAELALERWGDAPCEVLVGGLGLGYTAAAALDHAGVRRLVVLELLAPVLEWHRRRLVPMAGRLLDDARCSLVHGDFFEYVAAGGEPRDVILLDIDHSAESWLQSRHRSFYTNQGLRGLLAHLRPNGVFGFWSASKPLDPFLDLIGGVFSTVESRKVTFLNPHLDVMDSNWVVVAGLSA